jgi:hypothetical protein
MNYFNALPDELLLLICEDNAIFNALRGSYPRFSRFCEKYKISYLNEQSRLYDFPQHSRECDDNSNVCFYCYKARKDPTRIEIDYHERLGYDTKVILPNRDKNNIYNMRNYRYIFKTRAYYEPNISNIDVDYVDNEEIIIPPVWKNRAEVWMINGVIHRDYGFAIKVKGKYYAHYRLGVMKCELNTELMYVYTADNSREREIAYINEGEWNDDTI